MATENISFCNAVSFKKQNQITSAFIYSNIVLKKPIVYPPKTPPLQTHYIFPLTPSITNNSYQHSIRKSRPRSSTPASNHVKISSQKSFFSFNGSFLKYASKFHTNIQIKTAIYPGLIHY